MADFAPQVLASAETMPLWFLLLDAAIKATVVLLVAAGVLYGLRRSSAALRYQISALALASLVVLPVVTGVFPSWRFPLIPMPSMGAADEAGDLENVRQSKSATDQSKLSRDQSQAGSAIAPFPSDDPESSLLLSQHEAGKREALVKQALDREPPNDGQLAAIAPQRESSAHSRWFNWLGRIWMVGVVVTLLPLLGGILRCRSLVRDSHPIRDPKWQSLVRELAMRLGIRRRVILLEIPGPHMPMTWGWRCPAIGLPAGAENWPTERRRAVLLHELAHIQRLDVPMQMIARCIAAIYWFHPLVWYLNHRMRIDRELACDDCVLLAGERASDYATHLLEIASTHRAPLISPGAAMAESSRPSRLESRLQAILDPVRIRKPLSRPATITFMLATFVLVSALAAIGPRARAEGQQGSERLADDAPRPAEPDNREATVLGQTTSSLHFQGRVVDPQGKPVSKATVWLRVIGRAGRKSEIRATTKSDGRFEIQTPPQGNFSSAILIALAEGYGPDWKEVRLDDQKEVTLHLVPDDVPIQGRILDLEGRPVRNATIRVARIHELADSDPAKYMQAIRKAERYKYAFAKPSLPTGELFPETKTDSDGTFRVKGIGAGRMVYLALKGDDVHHDSFRVLTHKTETVQGKFHPRAPTPLIVYGASFEYVATPGRSIVGTAIDAQTGKPVQGIEIVGRETSARTKTDAQGYFELSGCRKGDSYGLLALPAEGHPYLIQSLRLEDQPGLTPLRTELKLYRGIDVTGHVIDETTGQPVQASIHYYPLYPNPHVTEESGFSSAQGSGAFRSAVTKPDGTFSMVALPGPGCLVVKTEGRTKYAPANVDAFAFFEKQNVPYGGNITREKAKDRLVINVGLGGFTPIPQSQFQGIVLLNPPKESKPLKYEIEVKPLINRETR